MSQHAEHIRRLFRIRAFLERQRRAVAVDLAIEMQVSVRQIYRDMKLLRQNGEPISAKRGDGYVWRAVA